MKRIVSIFIVTMVLVCANAQNKYNNQDVLDFKKGMLDAARKMTKSVPVQVSDFQTLTAVGVMENLVTFKYELKDWDGEIMLDDVFINETKSLTAINMLRSQQYLDLFMECLKSTKFEYQFLFFSEDKKYVGGFRLGYADYKKQLDGINL